MTTNVTPVLTSGVWKPSTSVPDAYFEAWVDSSGYNFNSPLDYYKYPVNSPRGLISNVFNGSVTVNSEFFGVHYIDISQSLKVPMDVGLVRIHDATFGGFGNYLHRTNWRAIHTAANTYYWVDLDNLVSFWSTYGVKMIYTIMATPNWASSRPAESGAYGVGTAAEPSNLNYLRDFVGELFTRYKGKIQFCEIWNEANLTSYFSGSQATLAAMAKTVYQTVKGIDPTVKVLSPNTTSWISGNASTYLTGFCNASDGASGTGKDWFDIVAVHLWPNASTSWGTQTITAINSIKSTMATLGISSRDIWNTEGGLQNPAATSLDSDKMKYVKRSAIISAALGLKFWSFYAYDAGAGLSVNDNPVYADQWNFLKEMLQGHPLTLVNQLPTGEIACVIDGNNFLI